MLMVSRALMSSLAEKRDRIQTSEDLVVSQVGQELYEKFFRNYTRRAVEVATRRNSMRLWQHVYLFA